MGGDSPFLLLAGSYRSSSLPLATLWSLLTSTSTRAAARRAPRRSCTGTGAHTQHGSPLRAPSRPLERALARGRRWRPAAQHTPAPAPPQGGRRQGCGAVQQLHARWPDAQGGARRQHRRWCGPQRAVFGPSFVLNRSSALSAARGRVAGSTVCFARMASPVGGPNTQPFGAPPSARSGRQHPLPHLQRRRRRRVRAPGAGGQARAASDVRRGAARRGSRR